MISLVIPYYNNPRMMAHQYSTWMDYTNRHKVEFIVVDDGSQKYPLIDIESPQINLKRYRIKKDIPWHWHGAKNLGAHVATNDWLLVTDIDHVLPEKSLEGLLEGIDKDFFSHRTIYTLARYEANGRLSLDERGEPKPHPNSFFMKRDLFWKIGGYDESYSGCYGTDSFYRRRAFSKATPGHLNNVWLVRYTNNDIQDAESDLPRKTNEQRELRKTVIRRKQEFPEIKVLDFEWEAI